MIVTGAGDRDPRRLGVIRVAVHRGAVILSPTDERDAEVEVVATIKQQNESFRNAADLVTWEASVSVANADVKKLTGARVSLRLAGSLGGSLGEGVLFPDGRIQGIGGAPLD